MLTHEQLFTFTPREDEQYSLQLTLNRNRLLGAADALDNYSCHSQPHVLEVMEQCGMLLKAFSRWLRVKIPGTTPAWMHDHLLLAAKLHDIGMCGTEPLRTLLSATDSLHTLLSSAGTQTAAPCEPFLGVLRTQARLAGMTNDTWMLLMRLAGDPIGSRKNMLAALAEYHEQLKSAIRKQHAANSGRYILAHAEEICAHYGPDIDVPAVAALAALHSSSSLAGANIVPEGPHYERIRDHIRQMVTEELSAAEADRITRDEPFRRIIHLAALLRLSDTRRSGSRLTNMDQSRLTCEVTGTQVHLYKEKNGLREPVPQRVSFNILASEALTEFGPVTVHPVSDGTWHIRHEMTLRHADLPDMQRIFASSRLKSYAEEIDTGALVYGLGYSHEIFLHLEGLSLLTAPQAIDTLRREVDWLRESPLKIVTL